LVELLDPQAFRSNFLIPTLFMVCTLFFSPFLVNSVIYQKKKIMNE
jgi:hypothetical protein